MKHRKYMKGETVESLHHLIDALEAERWLYYRDTPKHWAILANMSVNRLQTDIRYGIIKYAVPLATEVIVDAGFDPDFDETTEEGDA